MHSLCRYLTLVIMSVSAACAFAVCAAAQGSVLPPEIDGNPLINPNALMDEQDEMGSYGEGPGYNPGECGAIGGEGCSRRTAIGNKRAQTWRFTHASPWTLLKEHAKAGASSEMIKDLATSQTVITQATQSFTDPNFAAAGQMAILQAQNDVTSRFLSRLDRELQYQGTSFGRVLSQADSGCRHQKIAAGMTYAQADELCDYSDAATGLSASKFTALPSGDPDQAVDFSHYSNRGTGPSDSLLEGAEKSNKRKVLTMVSTLFNTEIETQSGISRDTAIALRRYFRKLIGDYSWEIKRDVTGSMEILDRKLPPEADAALQAGFQAIHEAIFKQVFHGIYAVEYAHCLVAAKATGAVAPVPVDTDEAGFWKNASKSMEVWPRDWDLYGGSDPLGLKSMPFKYLIRNLRASGADVLPSPGSGFEFSEELEADIWALIQKHYFELGTEKTAIEASDCEILKSWDISKRPAGSINQWKPAARRVDGTLAKLAKAIANAQLYGMLDRQFMVLGQIGNSVLDREMKQLAQDMLIRFAQYQDVRQSLDIAMAQAVSRARELRAEAAEIRGGLTVADNARRASGNDAERR